MANLVIPLTSVPGTDSGAGARILNNIRRGSLKFIPKSLYHLPLKFSDFAAAAVTKELVIGTVFSNRKFPANVWIDHSYFDITELFSGGAVATCTIQAGITATPNDILEILDVFTTNTTGVKVPAAPSPNLYGFQAALDLTVTLTTTVGNTDVLTKGKGILYIVVEAIPRSRA